MARTLGELARLVEGEVLGDPEIVIRDVAPLDEARSDELSFLANAKYRDQALETEAAAVVVSEQLDGLQCPQLRSDNPYLAMATIAAELHPAVTPDRGVASGAHVDAKAEIDLTASIGPGAVIEAGAQIGAGAVVGPTCVVGAGAQVMERAVMHAGSKLLERCVLGKGSILQAGAVVGSDGFGYAPDAEGRRTKIPQVGVVVIEDDVEIGANSTIDRATFGRTVIGRGSKLDNLVQIAHNVRLGEDCVIVAQSGIAGSTTLGSRVIMGAQSGSVGHIRLGDRVTLAARAAATMNLAADAIYGGAPAIPHRDWLRFTASLPKLPELRRRVRGLERKVEELIVALADTVTDKGSS